MQHGCGRLISMGRKKEEKQKSVGGLPFFLTLACTLFLGFFNLTVLPTLWNDEAFRQLLRLLVGVFLGGLAAKVFIVGHVSVVCHELKHFIVSQLAGNRSKGFQIKKRSGSYSYEYNKETEKYNALIALAPYWLPLSTIFAVFLSIPLYASSTSYLAPFVIGFGIGADAMLNLRDISPIQTDLTGISGGYSIALLFILGMNLTILTILLAWIFQGADGLRTVVHSLWEFMIRVVVYYRGL